MTGNNRFKGIPNEPGPKTDPNQPVIYQIRLRGHLGSQWTDWFEGLTITLEEDGDTLLTGPVLDQAALHGLLKKMRDLGMPLVSVTQVQSNETHPYRSKKENNMNMTQQGAPWTNKESAGNLPDVRIILAVLWAAGMLSSLNGDTYRLNDPVVLRSSLANSGPIGVTPELLLVMSSIFVGSILMSVFTLTLKSAISRWANRIMGTGYALIIFAFWILNFVLRRPGYEIVWSTAQLVFASMVVWYAWKWTNPVPQS